MKYKEIHNRRGWLNPKDHWDTGGIHSKVAVDEGGIDASLTIWDCFRKISLSFSAYTEKEAKQRAVKINLLIQHLQETKAAMGKAYALTEGEFSE